MDVVYARLDCMVTWSQGQTSLSRGEVWAARAPIVLERPDLFSKEPTRVRGIRQVRDQVPPEPGPAEAPVEDAAARPGAKRAGTPRKTRG